jgi:hypothetical protein
MATASAGSPRIDRYRFRTRSADADWDFFPWGCWGLGYRVNEAQRHRLMHSGWGITLLAAQFLISAAAIAAIGHIDYNNFWNAVSILLALVTPLSLFVAARWLCVWRLPPAERPLTLHEVQAYRALAHGRDKVLATAVGSATIAVLLLLSSGRAVTLEVTEGLRVSWFFISAKGLPSRALRYARGAPTASPDCSLQPARISRKCKYINQL